MNSYDTGKKYFKCFTNFDYYLLQNTLTNNNITKINDYDNLECDINLNEWDFIPSGMFSEINKLLKGDELTNVIYDRSIYDTRRKYLSKTKTDIYKYPIVYFITKTDGANFYILVKIGVILVFQKLYGLMVVEHILLLMKKVNMV